MVQMVITLNVTPSCHLVDWWEVRTVTLKRGRNPRLGLFEPAAQEPCWGDCTRYAAHRVQFGL